MPTESLADKGTEFLPLSWRLLFLSAAAGFVVLLFFLGSQPMAVGLFPEPWDKLAHMSAYGGIAILLWFASSGRWPLTVVLLVAGIGALDEWHQSSLPGRSMDYLDFLADVGAAIVTVALLGAQQK